jgi:hypothetical protein
MSLWTGWASKPPQGTPLDRTHGLVQGLVTFGALNEGSGNNVYDSVNGFKLVNAGGTWAGSYKGGGLNFNTTTSIAMMTSQPIQKLQYPITIACGWNQTVAAANGCMICCSINNTLSSPYSSAAFQVASGVLTVGFQAGAAVWTLINGVAVPLGENTASASIGNGSVTIFQNGKLQSTTAETLSAITYTTTSEIAIGLFPAIANLLGGTVEWFGLWNRVLSTSEHLSIANNPWQIFALPFPFWFGGAAVIQDPIGAASNTMAMSLP